MFNSHLFFTTANSRFTGRLLIICGILGFVVLADILCILMLSLLLGLWITMALLALITSIGVFLSYSLVRSRGRIVVNSTDQGSFDEDVFSSFLCALIASVFFIVPGIINTLLGIILVMRFSGIEVGARIASFMEINWQDAYEYLRLN